MRPAWTRWRSGLGALALIGCQLGRGAETMEDSRASPPAESAFALPAPREDGQLSLEEALRRRRSVRSFARRRVDAAAIGQLLWAAQGITDRQGLRTAPSAGALFPLECHVVTESGVFHYEPARHRLVRRIEGDLRAALAAAALGQPAITGAPIVVVITADYGRTAVKYGEERAVRYATLEAGHAAQNVLLQAVALGLGAVPIGAFNDALVARVLRLGGGEEPLYLIPIGHPR